MGEELGLGMVVVAGVGPAGVVVGGVGGVVPKGDSPVTRVKGSQMGLELERGDILAGCVCVCVCVCFVLRCVGMQEVGESSLL